MQDSPPQSPLFPSFLLRAKTSKDFAFDRLLLALFFRLPDFFFLFPREKQTANSFAVMLLHTLAARAALLFSGEGAPLPLLFPPPPVYGPG